MGLLAPWFALLLPFLTLCRTALFPLASLEHHPTVNSSLATFVLSQSNKSLAANLAQNQTVGLDLRDFDYDIPNTSRYVSIAIDIRRPLDPVSFHNVIIAALSYLNRHIALHGNGPLQPQDDPFHLTSHSCSSITESDRKDDGSPWLTYSILLETFIGLKVILDNERRYFVTGYSTSDLNGTAFGQGSISEAIHVAGAASLREQRRSRSLCGIL